MITPLSPYKGNEPYIFISYAHRDSNKIFPIIRQLQENSYRVWYDDGVDPGTEWDDNIAGYINRCTVFIAFLSENYISSKNCKDELSYSRELDKSQLLVYLEDLELPDGLKMRLNRLQAIFWNRYDSSTDAAFQTLCGAPNLNLCRETNTEASFEEPAERVPSTIDAPLAVDESAQLVGPSRIKRRIVLYVCIAVLVLAGIITAILLTRRKQPEPGSAAAIMDSSVSIEESVSTFDGDESSVHDTIPVEPESMADAAHVVLRRNEEMSDDEFSAALEILESRLSILAGDDSFKVTTEGDTIDLLLPKDCLADRGLMYTLRCYLSRPIDLYAFQRFRTGMEQEGDWAGTFERIHVAREDIEKVTIQRGVVTGADSGELAARGIESGTYAYIELVLTDDFAKQLSDASATWEDGLAFGQDMDNSTWYNYYTVPGIDGKTFYLINADQEDRFSELLEYNLSHAPLPYAFWISLDINEVTEWERVEAPDVFAGQNQCNADDFTEQTITFELEGYQSEYTPGEWYDLNTALKERLDALEIPYAFALHTEDSKTVATVRCPLRHMGVSIISLLGEKYWSIRAGLNERSLYSATVSSRQTSTGNYEIDLQVEYNSEIDDIKSISTAAVDSGDGVITLLLGDIPCLQSSVNQVVEDGRIIFDQCFLNYSKTITEDYAWFVALLDVIGNGTPIPVSFSLESIQYNPDSNGNIPTSEDFDIVDAETLQITQAIEAAYPGADVYTNGGTTLYVGLHLAIDDSLPEKSTMMAEEIYRTFDFENSLLSGITLYLVDEDDSAMERARIFFTKDYSLYDDDDAGSICAYGVFYGGRLEAYKELMQTAVENNAFLVSLYKPDEYGLHDWNWDW